MSSMIGSVRSRGDSVGSMGSRVSSTGGSVRHRDRSVE
jgi:hypothetical protein